jgi:hypothetical protein
MDARDLEMRRQEQELELELIRLEKAGVYHPCMRLWVYEAQQRQRQAKKKESHSK